MTDIRQDGWLEGQIYHEQSLQKSVSDGDAVVFLFCERTGPAFSWLRLSPISRSSCIAQVHELSTIFTGFVCSDQRGIITQGTRISDDKDLDHSFFMLLHQVLLSIYAQCLSYHKKNASCLFATI